jgi:flagellar biosynthesis/type III secretory pathway protein FliH
MDQEANSAESVQENPAAGPKRRQQAARIEAAEIGDMPFISQREFRPTPYVPTVWELVGEQVKERDFVHLAVNVLHDDVADPDPMFDVFDHGISKDENTFVHGIGLAKPAAASGEQESSPLAAEQLAQIQADWERQLEAAKKEAYDQGVRDAEATISERYEQLASRSKSITDAIYQQWATLGARLEKNAVDLALNVAKKILHTTVEVKPEYIYTVIRQALSQLGAAKPVRIRVSHDDYEFLNVIGLPVDLGETELGVTYVADESLKSGCVVESDFGELDLVLDRMWDDVKQHIYEVKK